MALDVVVVCDGDAARTKGLLANVLDPRLRIVEQPQTGVCVARNRGVAVTANPWVVFLDDDDSARPTWLELLARGATGAGVDVVTARLAFWEGDRIAEVRDCRLSPGDPTMGASTILPGGFAVRREVFESVGGYDESLTYSENQDLGLRILDDPRTAGVVVRQVPEVVVDFHREAASARVRRYRSAPADSARLFLARYARRFEGDRQATASFLRLIARSERHEHRHSAAVTAALQACRIQPTSWENYRSLAASVLPAPDPGRRDP